MLRQHTALRFHRIGEIAGKGEDGVTITRCKIRRQIAIHDLAVESGRHRHQHRIRHVLQKFYEVRAKPSINRLRVRVRRCRRHVQFTPRRAEHLCEAVKQALAGVRLLCERRRQLPRVPAEHHNVQGDGMRTIEGLGAAQNVIVGIRLDAAIQELIGRSELVDETRPAPANTEHHRVAPYHRQFPRRIASGAFQPELVNLEDDHAMTIDQHYIRSQSPRRVIETETFDRRGRREQMDALGLMSVRHCHRDGCVAAHDALAHVAALFVGHTIIASRPER